MFIQLLDDDIVSLTALMLIIKPKCTDNCACIDQLILSLYLMTKCQLKLRHSLSQLSRTLKYIKYVRKTCPVKFTFNRLTLQLIKCKVVSHLSTMLQY